MRHLLQKVGLLLAVLCYLLPLQAQSSDNGDGTFTNPVLWTDLPDPDVVQVGNTFYWVSTSMHLLPGVTVLESQDLVNWRIATNIVPQFDNDPYFNLQGGNRYGKGQWATAIRYWGGEFHVLFTSNTNGTFIYSSKDMQGPWKKTVLYAGPYHPTIDRYQPLIEQKVDDGYYHHILYDPGFLVDTDGRVYVVHGNTLNYITELDPATLQAKTPARLLYHNHRDGLEGNRPYHIGDYYYVICTYGGSHSGNITCMRSRSLDGPWEEREVLCEGARRPDSHVLQACLIPLSSGETWAMAFLDMGALGRIPHLIPVHWVDGWPVFGNWAEGNLTMQKPKVAAQEGSSYTFQTSDDFSAATLGLQWQFNHNPQTDSYSLTERPGWLRLHALKALQPLPAAEAQNPLIQNENPVSKTAVEVSPQAPFLMARNTLTQRLFGPHSTATAKVDVSHLKAGDQAGFALLNIPYATLTVRRTAKGFQLSQTVGDDQQEKDLSSIELTAAQARNLWLQADCEAQSGKATFAYSLNGTDFHPLGPAFQMEYSGVYFVGNRFAVFCYSNRDKGGYLDLDRFDVAVRPLFSHEVGDGTVLQAEYTDALWRTEIASTDRPDADWDVRYKADGGFISFRHLHFTENLSTVIFRLKNVAGKNVFLELRDATTQESLGKVEIPEPNGHYADVPMTLSHPLVSDHTLELRIWNADWDVPTMGEVLLDKLTFKK